MRNEDYVSFISKKPTIEKIRAFGNCIESAKDNWADYQQAKSCGTEESAAYFLSEHYAQWERAEMLFETIRKDVERLEKQARRGKVALMKERRRRK